MLLLFNYCVQGSGIDAYKGPYAERVGGECDVGRAGVGSTFPLLLNVDALHATVGQATYFRRACMLTMVPNNTQHLQ